MSALGKTIVLLGGSRQQVVAIDKARELGYRTVLCDFLPDNPGQHRADAFHLVSTTDREAVLKVARAEAASGILAYSSDPAAPTAAYVAKALGLPTNPLNSVEAMSLKAQFRSRMREVGLPCPASVSLPSSSTADEALSLVGALNHPIVLKPTDSSGSKGVTVVHGDGDMAGALDAARRHSRNGILIAEEYVERAFPHVVGGDVFVLDGEIRFWGLMSCLRNPAAPLIPVGKKTPSGLSGVQYSRSKDALRRLVKALGIRFGELNVEILIGRGDVPYVIELGARAGGNMIPLQLSDASGVDLVRANVLCAMGADPGSLDWEPSGECFATYVLHSPRAGSYRGLRLSREAEAACYRMVLYSEISSAVDPFDGADKALGILFFRFEDEAEMDSLLENIDQHVAVEVG